jgi:cytochrome c553
MHEPSLLTTVLVVLVVLLFVLLGTALVIIIDHKARIPEAFRTDPFSISGMRRDHPVIGFLTAAILLSIIAVLLLEVAVTFAERLGLVGEPEPSKLVQTLTEQRTTEGRRTFHNAQEVALPPLGRKPVCSHCHGDFPHSKEPMVRTLLNMHTQFLGCMTCHTDAGKVPEQTYRFQWLNYSGISVEGPPFGTDLDRATGGLIATDDYYSKIVVLAADGERETLLEIPEDTPEAREFLALRDQLSAQDREAVKKTFHRLVRPKGRFCSRCHTQEENSYIPFRRLGFSPQRISDLTNLNIVGIVQKYREFYMPNLFEAGLPRSSVEELVGPDPQRKGPSDDVRDPKAWWGRNFDAPPTQGSGHAQ